MVDDSLIREIRSVKSIVSWIVDGNFF